MYGIHKIHYKCHQMGQWLFNIAATRLHFNLFPVWIHSSGNSRRGIYLVYIYSAFLFNFLLVSLAHPVAVLFWDDLYNIYIKFC